MLSRYSLSLVLILLSLDLSGQSLQLDDTLLIEEVIVLSDNPDGKSGFRSKQLSSKQLLSFSGSSLADLLTSETALYLKSYGTGGLSTLSFRGMGSNHTRVLWDGIKVDNAMIGQTDFSIIPADFIDNISIYYGGDPGDFGNRGPGGTIHLQSKPSWNRGTDADLIQRYGSFGNIFEGINITTGTNNFEYRAKGYINIVENNYRYIDNLTSSDPTVKRRTDSKYNGRGVAQEVYFKSRSTVYSGKVWYTFSQKSLPGSLLTFQPEGNEKQDDESIRAIISYTKYSTSLKLNSKIAYSSNWLNYRNRLLDIDSHNHISGITGIITAEYDFSEDSQLRFGIYANRDIVNSSNYALLKKRDYYNFDLSISQTVADRIALIASLSQEIVDNDMLQISPSLGMDIRLHPDREYYFRGSIGRSNHLPSLNDLYWNPGGNPNLKSEESFNRELSFSIKESFGTISSDFAITYYNSSINNMIVWQPISASIWSPINISKVLSKGLEIDKSVSKSFGKSELIMSIGYLYTSVSKQNALSDNDNSVGKQIIYEPLNSGSFWLNYSYSEIGISWRSSYTGKRYTTSDNSRNLAAYWHHSFAVKNQYRIGSTLLVMGISIDNIFNADYQNVLNYPMPLRSIMLSAKLKFKNYEK